MKKALSIVLTVLLMLGLFVSCDFEAVGSLFDENPPAPTPPEPPAPVAKDLLQFTSQQDGSTIKWKTDDNPSTAKVSYSLDGTTWTEQDLSASPEAITVNAGQTVYFKGNNDTLNIDDSNYSYFEMTGSFTGKGNPMSLLDETFTRTDIPDYAFAWLLFRCTALADFELVIDADTIGDYAFFESFYVVGGDVTISDIKASSVGDYAFSCMVFTNGDVTVGDIELTGEGLGEDSFYEMLYYCCGDITIGDITVNGNLPDYSSDSAPFVEMISNCCCSSNHAKEELNTINVGDIHIKGDAGDYAFYKFSYNCNYSNLNMGNLTVDGDLGEYALSYFFYGDSYESNAKLTMGDITIGGTAEEFAFYETFVYCNHEPYDSAIVADPDKGLIEIGAMTFGNVEERTFEYMIATSSCTYSSWKFGNVTVTGTTEEGAFDNTDYNFLCGVELVNKATFKVNGEKYYALPPDTMLQFTSHQNGSTIQWLSGSLPSTAKVSYSLDGTTWTEQDLSANPEAITVNAGQTVYFKGNNDTLNIDESNYSYLKMTGSFTGKGNLMSLIDPTFTERDIPDYAFLYLFYDCLALTDFELVIDADTIGDSAFYEALYNVGGNVTISDIKASTVGDKAFSYMVYTEDGDVTVGDIEVTNVDNNAYYGMLYYCYGDITVGDITVNCDLPDYPSSPESSPFGAMLYACCCNESAAMEKLNTITVGDIHIKGDVGAYTFYYFFYDCYYANINMGNLIVDGDLGEYALCAFFDGASYYSSTKTTMGDITIGGTAEAYSFNRLFSFCNTFDPASLTPGIITDADKCKIEVGTLTIGNVEENAFNSMIDTHCEYSVWEFGDVTVTGTSAPGAFDKASNNFLCGVTPVNAATFKVNGELYF